MTLAASITKTCFSCGQCWCHSVVYNLASNGALTTLVPYHLCPTRAVDGEVQKGATRQTCVHSASQHSVLIQPTSPWARVDIFKQDPSDWRCQNMWYGCKKLRQLCISSTQYDACTAYVKKASFQLNGTQSRGEDIRLNRYSQTSGKGTSTWFGPAPSARNTAPGGRRAGAQRP